MNVGVRLSEMNRRRIIENPLVAFVAFIAICVVNVAMSERAPHQRDSAGVAIFLTVFCSIVTLHFLIWQYVLGNVSIFGRDPKSFISFGQPKTIFSAVTTFGYAAVALHCYWLAGFVSKIEGSDNGHGEPFSKLLPFGLTLIGIGLASRLRFLFQNVAISHDEIR